MRNAARVDSNQEMIVQAIRAVGVQTVYIKWPTDLIASGGPYLKEQNLLIEIKLPGAKLTGEQMAFWARWPGAKAIVHTVDEALVAVLGPKAMK
jgi:hypothetical protein